MPEFLVCIGPVDVSKLWGQKKEHCILFDSLIDNNFIPVSLQIFVKPFFTQQMFFKCQIDTSDTVPSPESYRREN